MNVNYTPGGRRAERGRAAVQRRLLEGETAGTTTSPVDPTQIVMCPASCSTLQADITSGAIDIVFGCATVGDSPK